MQQNKKEVAGQLFMDLDKCSVSPFDVDDRRNVFQVEYILYFFVWLVISYSFECNLRDLRKCTLQSLLQTINMLLIRYGCIVSSLLHDIEKILRPTVLLCYY